MKNNTSKMLPTLPTSSWAANTTTGNNNYIILRFIFLILLFQLSYIFYAFTISPASNSTTNDYEQRMEQQILSPRTIPTTTSDDDGEKVNEEEMQQKLNRHLQLDNDYSAFGTMTYDLLYLEEISPEFAEIVEARKRMGTEGEITTSIMSRLRDAVKQISQERDELQAQAVPSHDPPQFDEDEQDEHDEHDEQQQQHQQEDLESGAEVVDDNDNNENHNNSEDDTITQDDGNNNQNQLICDDNATSPFLPLKEIQGFHDNIVNHLPPNEPYIGLRSNKPISFFRDKQQAIDNYDNKERCLRYGYTYTDPCTNSSTINSRQTRRKIYYGTILNDESWELLEILSAEAYGIFEGMVIIESNRSISGYQRRKMRFIKNQHSSSPSAAISLREEYDVLKFKQLFGILDDKKIKIKFHIDESNIGKTRIREQHFRNEIVKGWKELGMTIHDIGYITSIDEMFIRDALRAMQICNIPAYDNYNKHKCYNAETRLIAQSRIYRSSPLCSVNTRAWHHPDMVIGYCIAGINNDPNTKHIIPPRDRHQRAKGYGQSCTDFHNITNGYYPLWTGGDFRTACGGEIISQQHTPSSTSASPSSSLPYSGYLFKMFDVDSTSIRYDSIDDMYFRTINMNRTNNNKNEKSTSIPLHEISDQLKMLSNCVKDLPDDKTGQTWKRDTINEYKQSPLPIYFEDEDYRRRKHNQIKKIVSEHDNYHVV